MTRRTVQELIEQVATLFPDNNTQLITPARVRGTFTDILDTYTPMYGGLNLVTRTVNLTTTPQVLTFDTELTSHPPEWTANPGQGTIARELGAVAAITSKIWLTGVLEGPQGSEVLIQLQENGTNINRQTEETMEGPSKSVGFALNIIRPALVNVTYRVVMSVPSGTATVTLREVQLVGENVPVREVPPPGKMG